MRLTALPDLTSHAIDPNDLAALATQHALADAWSKVNPSYPKDKIHVVPSIQHAVEIVRKTGSGSNASAQEGGAGKGKQVLVAGSLHLVGGVMEVAGLQYALSMV